MAGVSARQICGNCGAPNELNAVTCVVCGALLSAYASPPDPDGEPAEPIVKTVAPPSVVPKVDATPRSEPSQSAGDWRNMFESVPGRRSATTGPKRDLELDFRNDLPQSKHSSAPPPIDPRISRAQSVTAESPGIDSPPIAAPPSRPRAQPVAPTTSAPTRKPARGRSRTSMRPGVDPRFNRRRPQSIIGAGIFLLFMGCIVAGVLSAAGVGDVPVALAFLCLSPLGLVAIVIGVVISMSRKEGRGG